MEKRNIVIIFAFFIALCVLSVMIIYSPNAKNDINLQSLFKDCNLGKRDRCCWENNNDCCEIHSIFKKCNKVKTYCCKVKVTDPITRKTTIKYEKSNFSGGGGKF